MNASPIQLEILSELVNIGVGRGADILNTMLNSHIKLRVPNLRSVTYGEFCAELASEQKFAGVLMGFSGQFSGQTQLFFPLETAMKLVSTIVSDADTASADFDMVRAGTLTEIGNIVLNGVIGVISNSLGTHLNYTVPVYIEGGIKEIADQGGVLEGTSILMAETQFEIEELEINGNIAMFFEVDAVNALLELIDELHKSHS